MNPRRETNQEHCIETMDDTTSSWMATYHALPCAGEPTRAAQSTAAERQPRQARSASQPEAVYPSPDALSSIPNSL